MRSIRIAIPVGMFLLACSAQASAALAQSGQIAVNDTDRGIVVSYAQEQQSVVFTVTLPVLWDIGIYVDGNQDGKWGYGAFDSRTTGLPTGDLAFGRDADEHYPLCAQYVWSAFADNPSAPYESSQCGAFESKATIEIGAQDDTKRVIMKYRIPNSELFGTNDTAHLAFSLWDGKAFTYYFSPAAPLIIHK